MGRPRSYSSTHVVETAKNVFWERGYQRTAIEDLERRTRLNRSSLYLAFGTKRGLFDQALGAYIDGFIAPLLRPMERPGAGGAAIEGFFSTLAGRFQQGGPSARQGCLMINSIAELGGHDSHVDKRAVAYRDDLRRAFTNALGGTSSHSVNRRSRVLTAATLGAWLLARIDPADAAQTCAAMRAEVRAWRAPRE